jgi:hypothetical protein
MTVFGPATDIVRLAPAREVRHRLTPDIGLSLAVPGLRVCAQNCRSGIMSTKDQHHRPCHSSLAIHRARTNMLRKLTISSTSRSRSRRLLLHCGFRNHSAFPGSLWEA